ncbi:inner centromere protein-like isoform X2 [Microplitis mediator]|uniref:inner centromere protein-like isoform X2 n=1 Tax=Microplitis mediator TaxID=375433 RepID=UPI002556DFBD|nr:inner centromere protein-like isoform X2 [Microplitis mediator]
MDRSAKEAGRKMVLNDLASFHDKFLEGMETLKQMHINEINFIRNLGEQIENSRSGFLPKTPKPPRKRIHTIPEDEEVTRLSRKKHRDVEVKKDDEEEEEEVEEPAPRSRRGASIKANEKIKKQQSLTLNAKLRRPPSIIEDVEEIKQVVKPRATRGKRVKQSVSGSDDDEFKRPSKLTKMDKKSSKLLDKVEVKVERISTPIDLNEDNEVDVQTPPRETRQTRSRSSAKKQPVVAIPEPAANNSIDDQDNTLKTEASLYEDAISSKMLPMNSTMNPNTTMTIDKKMMNVTVVIDKIMNETVTLSKNSLPKISGGPGPSVLQSKNYLQNKLSSFKSNLDNSGLDEMLTDDESSPERVTAATKTEKVLTKKLRKTKPTLISETDDDTDDDNVLPTPVKTNYKTKDLKYKSNALFSPYAKESVKKKVEAFEQVTRSPTKEQTTGRITRTKTRAMATAATADTVATNKPPNPAAILARKSLAKAKKISIAKMKRDDDNEKENALLNSAQKSRLPVKNDKITQKQQLRTTPVSKARMHMPMSVNRIAHTPVNTHILPSSKAATAAKTNYLNHGSSVDSVNQLKPLSKSNSVDSLVDKKQRLNEEDARLKKEEALRQQTEEKRRKREEKELKNKLAREAKEKLEQEKRLKLEKEKELKAKQALIMQEKMREEAEKKRIAQLQRAQEKEEKKKQEEQLRLQKMQEIEETERKLAEQRRREQENERRKMAEMRAQQAAAMENAKLKQQYQAKVKALQQEKIQQQQQQNDPTSYKIDTDPDDDDSDNESNPKHPIPYWARAGVREIQLELQQYIPINNVLKFVGAKKCTPNLSELFVGIKKDRLKRTSSAVWRSPPRFSMMEDDD